MNKMTSKNQYERPRVETLGAKQIVELMGPVSCGSHTALLPVEGGTEGRTGSSSGSADLF